MGTTPERLAASWREQTSRYMGPGQALLEYDVNDESILVKDRLKGREFGANHGGETWGRDFVTAMKRWGYNDEFTLATGEEIASRLNGRGEDFLESVKECIQNTKE